KKTRRGRSTSKARIPQVPQGNFSSASAQVYRPKLKSNGMIQGRQSVLEEGGTSNSSQRPEDSETVGHVSPQLPTKTAPADTDASQQTNTTHPRDPASRASSVCSDAEPDSSDTDSSGSDEEEGEILDSSGWNIASPRSNRALELHTYLTTIPCPTFSEVPDSYTWCTTSREEP
ncbi:hypothetical protein HID58_013834, partial [Brassica napus]